MVTLSPSSIEPRAGAARSVGGQKGEAGSNGGELHLDKKQQIWLKGGESSDRMVVDCQKFLAPHEGR